MPQKKVTMIHSNFESPLSSWRLTMSITQRTKAIGCRKIASTISTMSLIMASVFHDRMQRARDARPAAGRRVSPVRGLLVGGFDPAPRDLPDRLEKTVDLGLGVVRRQARPNRARERFAPAGRHLSLHLRDVVPVHVQEVEDVRVGAKAAVADSDGPFVAQGRRDQAVVQPVDDKARQREAGAGRAGLPTTKHPCAGNAAQAGAHAASWP